LAATFFAVSTLAGCGGGESTPADSPVAGSPAPSPAPAPSPPGTSAAQLQWAGSNSTDVTGYRIYYGLSTGSYAQARGSGALVGNVTSYTISGLQSGRTYYFAVTAYDSAGNESAFSNEAIKSIP